MIGILLRQLLHIFGAQRNSHTFLLKGFSVGLDVGVHAAHYGLLVGTSLKAGETRGIRGHPRTPRALPLFLFLFIVAHTGVRSFLHLPLTFLAQLQVFGGDAVLHKLLLGEQLECVEGVRQRHVCSARAKAEIFNPLVRFRAACHEARVQLLQRSQKRRLCFCVPVSLDVDPQLLHALTQRHIAVMAAF